MSVNQQQKVIHSVFFWLNNSYLKEDKSALLFGLHALSKCPLIAQAFISEPAPTFERDVMDQSFDVSFIVHFDSVNNQDAYQIDDLHNEFIASCAHLWKKVKVYDSLSPVLLP